MSQKNEPSLQETGKSWGMSTRLSRDIVKSRQNEIGNLFFLHESAFLYNVLIDFLISNLL